MGHHATAGSFLGLTGSLWFVLFTLAAVAGVVWSLSRTWQVLEAGRRGVLLDRWGLRIRGLLTYAIGQKRMFAEPLAGAMHALIFWGFLVFSVRSVSLVVEGLARGWELPFLRGRCKHSHQ